jgi:mono/diheme cytochrome c family protein
MISTRKWLLGVLLLLLAVVAAGCAFVWFGVYDVGADVPHTRPMLVLMQTLRARSIHVRAQGLMPPPDLQDPKRVLAGAGHYAAMCTGCHLAPGVPDSEIRPGLYPQPPNLSQQRVDPRDAFWVIKHGVKMSAMPAWGLTHDDATIWDMVAFVQRLPNLTPAQYRDIVARAPPDEDMDGDAHDTAHDSMPGMVMPDRNPAPSATDPHDARDHVH